MVLERVLTEGALRKRQTFFLNITESLWKTISSKYSPPWKYKIEKEFLYFLKKMLVDILY